MPLNELFKAATFRLAVWFALAVTGATFAVFAFIYWQFSVLDLQRIDVILADEMARAVAEPQNILRRDLNLRVTSDIRRVDYAALFNDERQFISGNFKVFPTPLLEPTSKRGGKVINIQLPGGQIEPAVLIAGQRSDGTIVVIGRRLFEVYALRELLIRALITGLAPASLLALLIGLGFSARSARQLKVISQSIVRVMQGNLHERLPTDGPIDDVNYVTSSVNLMLDEIVRLLDQIKSVGDNIAHDLRTPLSIVHAKLERALAKDDAYNLRRVSEQVLKDLDRAMTTVEALLRISEIESGRLQKDFKLVELKAVCDLVFEIYAPLAEANAINIQVEAPEPVQIMGDFDLLVEAIANLVDNAIKFSKAGGCVWLTVERVEGAPTIKVVDNGCGVPDEDKPHIFKRFYRPTRNGVPGNGLGLSMAATIAKLHGLTLDIEDNNPGAIFRMSLSDVRTGLR